MRRRRAGRRLVMRLLFITDDQTTRAGRADKIATSITRRCRVYTRAEQQPRSHAGPGTQLLPASATRPCGPGLGTMPRHAVIARDRVNHCLRSQSPPDADEIDQNIILRRLLTDLRQPPSAATPVITALQCLLLTPAHQISGFTRSSVYIVNQKTHKIY